MPCKFAVSCLFCSSPLTLAVEIRVATFNIGAHFTTSSTGIYYPDFGIGDPGTIDHERVREILSRINADVVALQEIHGTDLAGNSDDIDALAANLGYNYKYDAPATNTFDTSLRVIFLSRFPFLSTAAIGSPPGAKEITRLFPAVHVDVPGTERDPLLVAAHLKSGMDRTDRFRRAIEMHRLAESLTARGLSNQDNYVVMGDFNLSSTNSTFETLPADLPRSYTLGSDISFPISYFTNPLSYFPNLPLTRLDLRQLDNSVSTFQSGSTIDLVLVSPAIARRRFNTEIYNSALDVSNSSGLTKFGEPLPPSTSTEASDHFALFADIDLDSEVAYLFSSPGQKITESFDKFTGAREPFPWTITGGDWIGVDTGELTLPGFRAYGSAEDPALGFYPAVGNGVATATFVNKSDQDLTALDISFSVEQWRAALDGSADSLSVEIVVNGIPQALPSLEFQAATNLTTGSLAGGVSKFKNTIIKNLAIAPESSFDLRFTFTRGSETVAPPSDIFVNEFHYDNAGTDSGEFIEIVIGPGFTGNLADIAVLLYNGSNGAVYKTINLGGNTFSLQSTHNGYRMLVADLSTATIQNGSPDGIAVVNQATGEVLQFLSYEGTFAATSGAASDMTSKDISVSQTDGESIGESALGLTGSGGVERDFIWQKIVGPYSKGLPNVGQSFVLKQRPSQGIALDQLSVTFLADRDGDGLLDIEDSDDDNDTISDRDEFVFGTDPADATSQYSVTYSDLGGSGRLSFPTVSARNYLVESSADLGTWDLVANYAGNGENRTVDLPITTNSRKFYRVRVTTQ